MNAIPQTFLALDDVTVRHLDKTLFKSLHFKIRENEQWALLGKSGSGKTALLHTLWGDFNLSQGHAAYPAFDRIRLERAASDPFFTKRKLIAFVDQQAHFKNKQNMRDFFYQQRYHAWFAEEAATVSTYLAEEAEKYKDHGTAKKRFTLDWVSTHLQLSHLLDKTLIQLSNGETRRLVIAHALLKQPMLLLLDNPFIGLDSASRPVLEHLLGTIAQQGVQLVMATTEREIPACITHIARLDQGNITFQGPRADDPRSPEEAPAAAWTPDAALLKAIAAGAPQQPHDFQYAFRMENIRVRHGQNLILKDVNWTVAKGEKWALTGANGAGKSTLLSLLTGDHPQAYANAIDLFDHKRGSGESIWEIKHRIGFVSPEMHQYFQGSGSCLGVLLSGLDDTMGFRKKETTSAAQDLARNWLRLLELDYLQATPFKATASGEQRLLLLLRALIKNPPLLILDEPCQGLDEGQKAHFKRIIDQLWAGREKTLLYVSHYQEDIPSCVRHHLQLEAGQVVTEH